MDSSFATVLVFSTICASIVLIVWLITESRIQRTRYQVQGQTELLKSMMDKFDTTEEFIEFLQSPLGQQAFGSVSMPPGGLMSGLKRKIRGRHDQSNPLFTNSL